MTRRILILMPYIIVIAGFLLRIIIYLQNRSLILDEANVAKNLYHRGLASLFSPLDYAQFAPPLFLCTEKIFGLCLGYSELVLRLVPLLSGCISLCLLWRILRLVADREAIWYPLLLMAFGYLFIRYATELKQYSLDTMIAMMLVWMTLRSDIRQTSPWKFCLMWSIAGSLAIWYAMPAVFVLCGVAGYYLYKSRSSGANRTPSIVIPMLIWSGNFLIYYKLILAHDSSSAYLQNWHGRYFLEAFPHTIAQLQHNAALSISILSAMGGHTVLALLFHLCLIIVGVIWLFRRNAGVALLLIIPLVCLLVASSMHKFTLLQRVILFVLPLLLILAAIGLQQAFALRSRVFRSMVAAIAIVCAANYCQFQYFYKPFEIEELKDGLQILQKEKIDISHVHVNFLIVPVYEYYTMIHPGKARWSNLAGAHCTAWNTDHDSLVQQLSGTHAFLYEWCDEERFKSELASDRKYSRKVSVIPFEGGNVVVLEK